MDRLRASPTRADAALHRRCRVEQIEIGFLERRMRRDQVLEARLEEGPALALESEDQLAHGLMGLAERDATGNQGLGQVEAGRLH